MKISEAQFSNWGLIRWKELTWAEHKKFQDSLSYKSPMAVVNDIYRAVVIIGPNYQEITAGIAEFIANQVFGLSAFTGDFNTLDIKLNQARQTLDDNFLLSAQAVISGIFGYKFEEINLWDEETFLLRLAQAEFVAGKPLQMGRQVEEEQDQNQNQIVKNSNQQKEKRELSKAQRMVIDRMNGK
jgi:hypothetical protein